MFIGNIDTFDTCRMRYIKTVSDVVELLRAKDFQKMQDGIYPIEGEEVFAKLEHYTTSVDNMCLPETHVRYADIQYVVEGEEELGWCGLNPNLAVKTPYDEKNDVIFYERLVPESSIILEKGSLVLLMPNDVHRAKGAVEGKISKVIKVVVKVAVDRLA